MLGFSSSYDSLDRAADQEGDEYEDAHNTTVIERPAQNNTNEKEPTKQQQINAELEQATTSKIADMME